MSGPGHNGAPAVVAGTFADLKTVKTRGVVQLVIEVPIERGAEAVEAFGFPQPGAEVPVAVARLVAGHQTIEHEPDPQPEAKQINCSAVATDKRKWSELPLSQRAAILCEPPRDGRRFVFPDFLRERYGFEYGRASADPTRSLKLICGITSRTELDQDPDKAERFLILHREFLAWNDNGQAA